MLKKLGGVAIIGASIFISGLFFIQQAPVVSASAQSFIDDPVPGGMCGCGSCNCLIVESTPATKEIASAEDTSFFSFLSTKQIAAINLVAGAASAGASAASSGATKTTTSAASSGATKTTSAASSGATKTTTSAASSGSSAASSGATKTTSSASSGSSAASSGASKSSSSASTQSMGSSGGGSSDSSASNPNTSKPSAASAGSSAASSGASSGSSGSSKSSAASSGSSAARSAASNGSKSNSSSQPSAASAGSSGAQSAAKDASTGKANGNYPYNSKSGRIHVADNNSDYRSLFLETSDAKFTAPELINELYSPKYFGGTFKNEDRLPSTPQPKTPVKTPTIYVGSPSYTIVEAVTKAQKSGNDDGAYYEYAKPDGSAGYVNSKGFLVADPTK